MSASTKQQRIAVLLPCRNEESSVEAVVASFQTALPGSTIYVYDNASTDQTARLAAAAGAIVRHEPNPGKGNVVRRMFADIEADIYVMADGDATYDASRAPELVDHLIGENLDMVVGARGEVERTSAYRPGHKLGNWILTRTVTLLFGQGFSDILSGYRVFSRRYVKTFPALATGFEIETELSVHALQLRMPVAEIETRYDARMAGSESKLNTWRDGFRILSTIMLLLKEVRPLFFFGSFSALLVIAAFILALPLLTTYMETGLVPRFPTAILSTGMVLLAFLSLTSGVILDSLSRARLETKRMRYLELSTVSYTTPSEDVTRHER